MMLSLRKSDFFLHGTVPAFLKKIGFRVGFGSGHRRVGYASTFVGSGRVGFEKKVVGRVRVRKTGPVQYSITHSNLAAKKKLDDSTTTEDLEKEL